VAHSRILSASGLRAGRSAYWAAYSSSAESRKNSGSPKTSQSMLIRLYPVIPWSFSQRDSSSRVLIPAERASVAQSAGVRPVVRSSRSAFVPTMACQLRISPMPTL
jgi:hypothetical protein